MGSVSTIFCEFRIPNSKDTSSIGPESISNATCPHWPKKITEHTLAFLQAENQQALESFHNEYKYLFEAPGNLKDVVNTSLTAVDSYAAVFVPGGHGAMLGIPEDENVQMHANGSKQTRF